MTHFRGTLDSLHLLHWKEPWGIESYGVATNPVISSLDDFDWQLRSKDRWIDRVDYYGPHWVSLGSKMMFATIVVHKSFVSMILCNMKYVEATTKISIHGIFAQRFPIFDNAYKYIYTINSLS